MLPHRFPRVRAGWYGLSVWAVRFVLMGAAFALSAGLAASCADSTATTATLDGDTDESGPSKLLTVDDFQDRLARGIKGSSHDFTQGGGRPVDLCTPCHTPHLAAARPPLLDQRPETLAVLRPYQSLDIELDDSSLLCLSCHDGVVASDVFSFAHSTTLPGRLGTSWVGTGTLQSHPVGVVYPIADQKYEPVSGVISDGRIKLPAGRVQCISCHDPHNTERYRGMLVTSNEGSRLCLACHRL